MAWTKTAGVPGTIALVALAGGKRAMAKHIAAPLSQFLISKKSNQPIHEFIIDGLRRMVKILVRFFAGKHFFT